MCVCVCVRERERESEWVSEWVILTFVTSFPKVTKHRTNITLLEETPTPTLLSSLQSVTTQNYICKLVRWEQHQRRYPFTVKWNMIIGLVNTRIFFSGTDFAKRKISWVPLSELSVAIGNWRHIKPTCMEIRTETDRKHAYMWDTKQTDFVQVRVWACKYRGAMKLSSRQILGIKTVSLSNLVFTK
jgi:hypothetical protein